MFRYSRIDNMVVSMLPHARQVTISRRRAGERGGTEMYLLADQLKAQGARRPATAAPGAAYRPVRTTYFPKYFSKSARRKRRVTISDIHIGTDRGSSGGTALKDTAALEEETTQAFISRSESPSVYLKRRQSAAPPSRTHVHSPRTAEGDISTNIDNGRTDNMTAVVAPLSTTGALLTGSKDLSRKGSYPSTYNSDKDVLDLPPIGNGVRVRSRPSSGSNSYKRNSLPESGLVAHQPGPQSGYPVNKTLQSQKPQKISVNVNPNDGRPRCSPLSPASTGSTGSSPMSDPAGRTRGTVKTWATTEQTVNSANSTKLETLFERQNTTLRTVSNKDMTRHRNNDGTVMNNTNTTRARHESTETGNSSSGVYSRGDSKVAKRGSLYSSNNAAQTKNTRPGLQRYKSEQNISQQKSNNRTTNRPLRQVKSQGQLSQAILQTSRSIPNLTTAENTDQWLIENGGDGYESESDNERDTRIMEWLLGVDELAEAPPEPPAVIDDPPPQTDTAIHIVYEER